MVGFLGDQLQVPHLPLWPVFEPKGVCAVVALLWQQGTCFAPYLDEWLMLVQLEQEADKHACVPLRHPLDLGFVVNGEKGMRLLPPLVLIRPTLSRVRGHGHVLKLLAPHWPVMH